MERTLVGRRRLASFAIDQQGSTDYIAPSRTRTERNDRQSIAQQTGQGRMGAARSFLGAGEVVRVQQLAKRRELN